MNAIKLCFFAFCVTVVSVGATVPAVPAAGQTCVGDCNSDDSVAIGEIILGVRTLLGEAAIGECRAMDGDGNGVVTVNELVAAVSRALQGCGEPVPRTIDEAALAASVRVASDSLFRLFDFQASVDAARSVAAESTRAAGPSTGVSGCQQFDCFAFGQVSGTREDCCSDGQFSQFFSGCDFDDDLGRIVTLDGLFVLDSDSPNVCKGFIPAGVSFTASLSNFTQDVRSPDGSFSHTFQELTEVFEVAPGGCTTASQPDPFGFGIRGDGLRFIDGELRQFLGDGRGNVRVDIASRVHALQIAVSSTQEADGCTVGAALNGSVTSGDFGFGREFTADFTDLAVVERSQAGALLLGVDGTIGIDCVGEATLSTIEPLRIAPSDTCFTAGRLEAQREDGTVSVTYSQRTGLDFDFGADGSVDRRFATCTDVPVDQCKTSVVGLCGPCTGLDQCQTGLGCFPCSRDCSDNVSRCSLSDTFVICEDGVF